jgi:hypothetical protein
MSYQVSVLDIKIKKRGPLFPIEYMCVIMGATYTIESAMLLIVGG